MVEDLTVLLVGDDEPDEKLVEQLAKKNLNVEISAKYELGSLLALVEPHIVVHIGRDGAEATVDLLKHTEEVRRVRLIVLAERDTLTDLRKLDRTVVVSLLANDIAPSVIAARVLMLAKKGPEKSLRPPSTMAQPMPKAAPAKPAPAKPAPAKPAPAKPDESPAPTKPSPPRAEALKTQPAPSPTVEPGVPRANAGKPISELPTTAVDLSSPQATRRVGDEVRVVLADDDVTRADLLACALREANIPTRIVPLDAAKTHWPLVREFAPTMVIGDESALQTVGQVWLQLFQADQALREAQLVTVSFDRLCRLDEGSVDLRPLIPQIPGLTSQIDGSGRPTAGPVLPPPAPRSSPTPAPRSSPIHSSPVPYAPIPFEDDDPDEFERLTVARPIDLPLPTEATRSQGPEPALLEPAAGTPAGLAAPSSSGPRPVFDSFAPALRPPDKVREGTAAPSPSTMGRQGDPPRTKPNLGRFALVAIPLLVLGAAGGWFAFQKKLPALLGFGPPKTASAPEPLEKSSPAPLPDAPAAPPEDAPSPEQLLWKVPSTPAASCEELVKNLEDLKVGGIQQAAVSLGKARHAMVLGQLDDAQRLMCEAVLVHPESLGLEELAALYLTRGSPEQALEWYEKAVALRPDRARTLELGGDIHSQLGSVAEAKAAFVAALRVKPGDEKTLKAVSKHFSDLAHAKFKSGAFDAATLLYRRSATLDQENAEAFAGLAATSAAVGSAQAAGRWADKTLLLDEGHHVALVVKAALATEAGDTEQAMALTEKALERNRNYLPAHQLHQKLKGE